MSGPWVHAIDPIFASIGGVHLWWYGGCYAAGLFAMHLFLQAGRERLALTRRAVWTLTLLLSFGVLAGGRLVEVAFYEWPFYREHPRLIPALWLGGMASHGLLGGALAGIALFAWLARRPLLVITDALVVPAALILAFGRLGNFIDGQIVGSPTDLPWAVVFPDAEGARHPVVLYDGLKNLLLAPLLVAVARRGPPQGVATGVFLFLYAALRIVVDLFREYPGTLLGIATGQVLNLAFCAVGLLLILWPRGRRPAPPPPQPVADAAPLRWQPPAFAALLAFVLLMPSDWTQDIPARYGKRHPGLVHSALYPPIGPGR